MLKILEYIIAALLILLIILVAAVLISIKKEPNTRKLLSIEAQLDGIERSMAVSDKLLREELSNALDASRRSSAQSMESGFYGIQSTLNDKLDTIRSTVDEKMTKTLNERLDSNFKQIGEQLAELYKSLGELNSLSGGVMDLNRTLSNVKARGIWGEQQLAAILEDTMTHSQYDRNVITKRGSQDRVEFAVKLPSGTSSDKFTYLPIDSKMPSDIYKRIYDASRACDPEAVAAASKELELRIKSEAKTISSKYIDPPNTTDFAIMFLPTEGLYAEVLRIDGLSEWCQTNEKIMIAGPTTVTALLNSLRVGFRNVALNEKSLEVMRLLMAVKTQYLKFGEQIENVRTRLNSALKSADELKHRSDIIQRKMSTIDELDNSDSAKLLGLEDFLDE